MAPQTAALTVRTAEQQSPKGLRAGWVKMPLQHDGRNTEQLLNSVMPRTQTPPQAPQPPLPAVRAHLDWFRRTGATQVSQRYRAGVLRRLAAALPDGVTLLTATRDDLEKWQSDLQVSISTIAGYTSHVRRFYGWCVEHGHLDTDPSLQLPLPRVPGRKPRPVPDEDLAVALQCARHQQGPMRVWLVLAAYMGLRAMEIAGMRRENITAVDGRLYIDGIGKGNKPFRLCVPVDVEPELRPYLIGSTGPIFRTGPGGRPSRPYDVSMQTRDFFRRLGMPYSIHRLRHSFGTAIYAQTRDVLITQDLMRHTNANTTRLYVQTTRVEAVKALDRNGRSLRPSTATRRRPATPSGVTRRAG